MKYVADNAYAPTIAPTGSRDSATAVGRDAAGAAGVAKPEIAAAVGINTKHVVTAPLDPAPTTGTATAPAGNPMDCGDAVSAGLRDIVAERAEGI